MMYYYRWICSPCPRSLCRKPLAVGLKRIASGRPSDVWRSKAKISEDGQRRGFTGLVNRWRALGAAKFGEIWSDFGARAALWSGGSRQKGLPTGFLVSFSTPTSWIRVSSRASIVFRVIFFLVLGGLRGQMRAFFWRGWWSGVQIGSLFELWRRHLVWMSCCFFGGLLTPRFFFRPILSRFACRRFRWRRAFCGLWCLVSRVSFECALVRSRSNSLQTFF